MHKRTLGIAAAGAVAIVVAAVLVPSARSQIQVTPVFVPIGAASGPGPSTVWFHERSSRRTMACQTVLGQGGALTGIQCVTADVP